MVSFIAYDIAFLVLFSLIAIVFLYRNKKNLKRQGILFLYPTKIGIELIEKTTKKYSKILKPLQYVIITSGYLLMLGVIWMFVRLSYLYLSSPDLARQLKVPIVTPLIPYIDSLFNLDFLPPFYFTYWIIIIAIIAVPHEFFHGIFARLNKIKVHSTGFGFLGPFLAAFVEPDEKQTQKSSKFAQLSILAAGTFANVLMTVLFAIILWGFFLVSFSPSGVYFNSYSGGFVNVSDISSIEGIPISQFNTQVFNSSFIYLESGNMKYHTTPQILKNSLDNNLEVVYAFDDSPAFNANLIGAITEINNVKIGSYEMLKQEILNKQPGEEVKIKTNANGQINEYSIILSEREGNAFLGIARADSNQLKTGLISSIYTNFYKLIDPIKYHQYFDGIQYQSLLGNFGIFIYNLLWWTILINISVALVNMLPIGIFDGGRFFMLTIWGITGSKKAGEIAFKSSTYLLLAVILAWILQWFFAII